MGGRKWTNSSVPADGVSLRQNKLLRETQSMSAERERELTVYPVVQLPVLVGRFVGTPRVFSCHFFDSIVPSTARASGKHQVVAGTVKESNGQDPLPLSHQLPVAMQSRQLLSSTPACSIPGLR